MNRSPRVLLAAMGVPALLALALAGGHPPITTEEMLELDRIVCAGLEKRPGQSINDCAREIATANALDSAIPVEQRRTWAPPWSLQVRASLELLDGGYGDPSPWTRMRRAAAILQEAS